MQPESTRSIIEELGLRPVPGPEPVPEAGLDWGWLTIPLILAFVLFVLLALFRRRAVLTPEARLEQALGIAQLEHLPVENRYSELLGQLRAFLAAKLDRRWQSFAAPEVRTGWEAAFPKEEYQAAALLEHFSLGDYLRFGGGRLNTDQLQSLIALTQTVQITLLSKEENDETK